MHSENFFPITHEPFRAASAEVPQCYKEQKDYCLILRPFLDTLNSLILLFSFCLSLFSEPTL